MTKSDAGRAHDGSQAKVGGERAAVAGQTHGRGQQRRQRGQKSGKKPQGGALPRRTKCRAFIL